MIGFARYSYILKTNKMIYNFDYDYLDLSQYVKKFGKTTFEVPNCYTWQKEIHAGTSEVTVFSTFSDMPFVVKTHTKTKLRTYDWTVRMTCPDSLSKYMLNHKRGNPSVYEIEYKNNKFIVTKKTREEK